MLHRLLIALAALLMPATVLAQEGLEGTWDFRVDETTIFRFTIEEGTDGEWLGEWQRPEVFNTDGNNFGNMRGGVKTSPSMTGIEFLGMVELSFDDPRPGAIPDIFRFELKSEDAVEMTYVGTDLAPYPLVRAAEGDAIGDWDEDAIYRRPLPQAADPVKDEPVVQPRSGPGINFLDLTPRADVSTPDSAGEGETVEPVEEDLPVESAEDEPDEPATLIGDDFLEGL